jgi:hypothetical protein
MKSPYDIFTQDLFGYFFGTSKQKMARRKDPDTSHKAAEKVDSASLERMVYEVIAQFPDGCISDDVVMALPGYGVQTLTPRFSPLLKKGFIVDTGERRVGKAGKQQRVMKVIKSVKEQA